VLSALILGARQIVFIFVFLGHGAELIQLLGSRSTRLSPSEQTSRNLLDPGARAGGFSFKCLQKNVRGLETYSRFSIFFSAGNGPGALRARK
jgi:hypothetical protein